MRTQCKLLGVARSSLDYVPVAEDAEDARLKRILDELYLCDPCLGSRRLVAVLERDHGMEVNRKRLQRLRREMGLEAIWCKPRTSQPDKQHTVHPYLLRGKEISRLDEVWCTDITYVPMPRGHAFLCAVMDWNTRCVLGWAVGNTMDVALCLLALERAVGAWMKHYNSWRPHQALGNKTPQELYRPGEPQKPRAPAGNPAKKAA